MLNEIKYTCLVPITLLDFCPFISADLNRKSKCKYKLTKINYDWTRAHIKKNEL